MTDSVKIYFEKKNNDTGKVSKKNPVDPDTQEKRDEIDKQVAAMPKEHGGRPKEKGLDPTRYGDWELKGRCIDF